MKDVSSNDVDWIRDLRFILIDAQKNYVLDASLGDRPIAGARAGPTVVGTVQPAQGP